MPRSTSRTLARYSSSLSLSAELTLALSAKACSFTRSNTLVLRSLLLFSNRLSKANEGYISLGTGESLPVLPTGKEITGQQPDQRGQANEDHTKGVSHTGHSFTEARASQFSDRRQGAVPRRQSFPAWPSRVKTAP